MAEIVLKDPESVLDYTQDWSNVLATGESISTSAITVPVGLTEDSETNTTTTSTVWLSGGTDGVICRVLFQIVTDNATARTFQRSLFIRVKDR